MPSLTSSLLALAAGLGGANAAFQGFNYGASTNDGTLKTQSDFEAEFKAAQNLPGTNGAFTSARLYTMLQGESGTNPIEAIPAGIATKTSLLFGIWASAGDERFNNELAALQATIDQYCGQLDNLVAGISVGSEDLYRISPTGLKSSGGNPGVGPDVLVRYIKEVRKTIKGTCLSDVPVGHVDTWTAYVNGSNQALIDNADWLGMDTYPYFESTKPNAISQGKSLFEAALNRAKGAAGSRPVWITESGWPVSGDKSGAAVASTQNARKYWVDVGCPLFGETNTWWYTLQDAAGSTPNPSFGVLGSDLNSKPLFDLSCSNTKTTSSSSAASKATSSAAASKTGGASGNGSGSGSGKAASATGSDAASATSSAASKAAGGSGSGSGSKATSLSTAVATASSAAGASWPTYVPSPNGGNGTATNGTVTSGSGSGSGATQTGSGSGSSSTSGSDATGSDVPHSMAGKVNSVSAAVVAMVLAVGIL